MNWNDLDLNSKSKLMKLYLQNGITSLDEMKNHYNSFADGGKLTFQQWKAQMQSKYPDIEMDNNKAGYDYETYFNDNYDEAVAQLSNLQHFPDTYKLYNHPTFSNESIYSRGPMIGGSWGYSKPWETQWGGTEAFIPSVVNKQVYPNIYKEDRPYTEEEIYGHKFDIGGPTKKYPFLQTSWRFEENPEPEKVAAYWPSAAGEIGWLPEVNIEASPNTEKGIAINTMLNNMSRDEKNHFFTIYPRSADGSITSEGQAYLRNQYYRKHFGKSYDNIFMDKLGDRVGIASAAIPAGALATRALAALGYGTYAAAPYIVYGAERVLPAIEQTAIRAASSTLPQELGKQLLTAELYNTGINLGTSVLSGGKYQMFPDVVKDFTKAVTNWNPANNYYTNTLYDFLFSPGYYKNADKAVNEISTAIDATANLIHNTTRNVTNNVNLYTRNVQKRIADVALREGDVLMNRPIKAVQNIVTNKKALNYIFNPKANPNDVYNLGDWFRYNGTEGFSGPSTLNGKIIKEEPVGYQGDVIDLFLGKHLDKAPFELVDNYPNGISDYTFSRYGIKNPRVYNIGTVDEKANILQKESFGLHKAGKPVLDPGGHVTYGQDNIGTLHYDIWKYNPEDFMKRWAKDNWPLWKKIVAKKATSFIDRQGEPIAHIWTQPWGSNIKTDSPAFLINKKFNWNLTDKDIKDILYELPNEIHIP